MLRELGLFAGIGGLSLGLERTGGFRTTAFCEVDPYCQAVLKKHWPAVPVHGDVRELHITPGEFDIISGGFPCQPVSLAGKREAQDDPRWLWPEFARLIGEGRPRYVLVENVRGLCSKGLTEVLADLARMGYDAEWQVVSAASAGAPHLRERILLVAYPQRVDLRVEPGRGGGSDGEEASLARLDGPARSVADADGAGLEVQCGESADARQELPSPERGGSAVADADDSGRNGRPGDVAETVRWSELEDRRTGNAVTWAVEPNVGRVAHGVPARVDRLRCLGNAVVPQVAEYVGHLILDLERAAEAQPRG